MAGSEFTSQGDGSWTFTRESDGTTATPFDAFTVAVTVLYHPDLERVGEVSRFPALSGRFGLSRVEPLFEASAGQGAGRALLDRGLSRQPHTLSLREDGGVRIVPAAGRRPFDVNGVPLPAEGAEFSSQAVRDGLIVLAANRVVLLLHHLPPQRAPLPSFGLVGKSAAVQRLRESIQRLCHSETHVLLRGESGTGKELVARAIHESSARRNGPFLAVNLATVPTQLVASTLFGHVAGAFTGAQQPSQGIVRQAQGGTLLLDEIGEVPIEVQVSLLRFLETKTVHPVGAGQAQRVDVRILAATDADLEQQVTTGRFRAALLHRLESYCIRVPSLRDRRDDVGRLLLHFLRRELAEAPSGADELQRDPARDPWLPGRVAAALARYDWPGNVRELHNAVRQLVIWNRGRDRFELPSGMRWSSDPPSGDAAAQLASTGEPAFPAAPPKGPVVARNRGEELEPSRITAVLQELQWRIGPAAKALGVSRNTLLSHMERIPGLHRPKDYAAEDLLAAAKRNGGDQRKMAAELRISLRGLKLRMTELGLN
jgi:two-component system, NtrC family, nitrogen regulation response regulator GlnG